jgi:hypothetical protein|tara:strand:- start:1441 stop:1905 length:465 start_codon:yes stop_codon:yes gene_type:complete
LFAPTRNSRLEFDRVSKEKIFQFKNLIFHPMRLQRSLKELTGNQRLRLEEQEAKMHKEMILTDAQADGLAAFQNQRIHHGQFQNAIARITNFHRAGIPVFCLQDATQIRVLTSSYRSMGAKVSPFFVFAIRKARAWIVALALVNLLTFYFEIST